MKILPEVLPVSHFAHKGATPGTAHFYQSWIQSSKYGNSANREPTWSLHQAQQLTARHLLWKNKRISMVASKSFSMLFGLKSKVIWWCCLCHYVKLKGSIPFIQICSKIIFFFLVHISDSLSWNRWPETGLLVPCQEEWVASSLSGNAIAFYLLRHKDRQTQLFNIPSIEMIESRKSVPKTTLSNECMTQRLCRNPSISTFLLSVPVE